MDPSLTCVNTVCQRGLKHHSGLQKQTTPWFQPHYNSNHRFRFCKSVPQGIVGRTLSKIPIRFGRPPFCRIALEPNKTITFGAKDLFACLIRDYSLDFFFFRNNVLIIIGWISPDHQPDDFILQVQHLTLCMLGNFMLLLSSKKKFRNTISRSECQCSAN